MDIPAEGAEVNPHTRRLRSCIAVLIAAGLAATLAACSKGTPRTGDGSSASADGALTRIPVPERKPGPDLVGEDLDGRPLSVAKWRGNVVVINVWGSWCPPCRKEMPVLKRVSQALNADGVRFMGIAIRESAATSRAFTERIKVPYPSISDEGGKLLLEFADTLPAVAVPTTYVLDRQGRLAARFLSVVTKVTLTDVVTDVLKESADG